jgi:hypothetical protein
MYFGNHLRVTILNLRGNSIDNNSIIKAIDDQIGRLQEAKRLIGGISTSNGRRGARKGRRKLSAKARKAISLAQKARWAKQKRAA